VGCRPSQMSSIGKSQQTESVLQKVEATSSGFVTSLIFSSILVPVGWSWIL
jgi:hypothetical protein